MIVERIAGLLVRAPAGLAQALRGVSAGGRRITVAGIPFELEPLFGTTGGAGPERAMAQTARAEWYVARTATAVSDVNPWEVAHGALSTQPGAGAEQLYVEPDFLQRWPCLRPDEPAALEAVRERGVSADQDRSLPYVEGRFAWHLDADFSQLKQARCSAGMSDAVIRIAHLDTGYDPEHQTLPQRLRHDLERNYVDPDRPGNAADPQRHGALRNPGHGTATLALLAGNKFDATAERYVFNDYIGGAPGCEIVPLRVGNSVVQFLTSDIAKAIEYAAQLCASEETRIHVLSMSMGGVASAAWSDAVNRAYDQGIAMVTAAGNNFSNSLGGFPTHFIVYPARFRRVIAACGVMADRTPYYGLKFGTMQGNWGPPSTMATALSAFTPNLPWAASGYPGAVAMNGRGTSGATPQIAAAAALYLQKHAATLFDTNQYPEPWMRVETVRNALFSAADKTPDGRRPDHFGNGILQSARALAVAPPPAHALRETPPDSALFAFLRVLTGIGLAPASPRLQMLALEATQLAQLPDQHNTHVRLSRAVADPDLPAETIPLACVQRYLEAILDHEHASEPLKKHAEQALLALGGRISPVVSAGVPQGGSQTGAATATVSSPEERERASTFTPPVPPYRSLRVYSVDPSLASTFATAPISEVMVNLPWEPVGPGPAGEYVEVIDVDPATGCFYEPIDLNDPRVLAQDGLAPSQGTPQFHQQMVYAVINLTIRHFEMALGRRTLWRPRRSPDARSDKDDSVFVPRLRVYPHALREQNAFYSPEKIALLFGYFNAEPSEDGSELPGGMIFTCLSQDIVAHETTHALVDGMHRKFINATNPDVPAFHEAFADIVALLQHFTFPEIVQHQIAATRGEIQSHETLLAELAGQFGYATGLRQALRDAIGKKVGNTWMRHEPDPTEYGKTEEPHARGAILVAAVFDAFLAIYGARTSDLLRLATGGTGVLRPGAIHPDLVRRLSNEAAKTAEHVLTMCIRALDYCPPIDITFGEFLRAIITADYDLVPDDRLHYRVAFVEAFRRRGIYPPEVRSLSVDRLLWRGPDDDAQHPSRALQSGLKALREPSLEYLYAQSEKHKSEREVLFALERRTRLDLHCCFVDHFARTPHGHSDAEFLGIDPARPFEVHTARFALRNKPGGGVDPQILITILQNRMAPLDPSNPDGPQMTYEGGATLVADLRRLEIRYCIRKRMESTTRLARQQAYRVNLLDTVRSTYVPPEPDGLGKEPFAVLHRAV